MSARRHCTEHRYYRTDITGRFVLADMYLQMPTEIGIGVEPLADELDAVTIRTQWLPW
ncbi:MAG: hypothetical protein ACR2LX_05480 [Jatrophihabitans sp.]